MLIVESRQYRYLLSGSTYPILVEVEGGVFSGGRHTRGKGYSADCEKYSAAAILGWVVIRGTTEQVKKGIVVGWIEEAITKLKV